MVYFFVPFKYKGASLNYVRVLGVDRVNYFLKTAFVIVSKRRGHKLSKITRRHLWTTPNLIIICALNWSRYS